MKKLYPFFAYVSRMKLIRRWGLMRNLHKENDMEHAAQTAMIAHALALLGNRRYGRAYDPGQVMALGLYHDSAEVITGDMPTPVKHGNAALHREYAAIETAAARNLAGMLPEDVRPDYLPLLCQNADAAEHKLVKAADRICAYIKCVEELQAGNREFEAAGKTVLAAIEKMELPEAQDFMREMLPCFAMNLDEMLAEEETDE